MKKTAPGWGKAIGIIMICLGSLGVFYQIYKIMIPGMMKMMPDFSELSRYDQGTDPTRDVFLNEFDRMIGLSDGDANTIIMLGYLGIALLVFYIIGGAKLLTPSPSNYNLAKYALIAFIVYNAIGLLLFFGFMSSYLMSMILIYAIIGLVFDLAMLIILLSSDKRAYGIGTDIEMQSYTLDPDDGEII